MIEALTLTLLAFGLLHVWLQLYNRHLLLLAESPRKATIHHLSLVLLVPLPILLLALMADTDPVNQALRWRPAAAESRTLFVCFGFIWVFALFRFGSWFSDKLVPARPKRLVSDQIRRPRLPEHGSALPRLLRPMETTHDLQVRRMELEVPALAAEFDGLTIALVSDIHYDTRHNRGPWFEEVVDIVNSFDADIVVFTGDFINRRADIPDAVAFHARMKGRLATLAVLGNHDYWTSAGTVRRECRAQGIRSMHNRRWQLERAGRRLLFAGTDAPWGKKKSSWHRLLAKDTGDCLILLSHTPDNTPQAARHGANLILSGHTHGGQACFPVVGPVVVPSRHGHRFVEGVIDAGPDTVLVVSRGVGTSISQWGGRTLCPPEVILLTLRAPVIEVTVPGFALERDFKGSLAASLPG